MATLVKMQIRARPEIVRGKTDMKKRTRKFRIEFACIASSDSPIALVVGASHLNDLLTCTLAAL